MTTSASPTVGEDHIGTDVAELVSIDRLVAATISPRHGPPDRSHVRALKEVMDLVPPILVHRATMAVIDGAHRVAAARDAGRTEIRVTYFDGDALDAFVLAIEANSAHGRPLSVSERKGAAKHLLEQWPDRSTRWIASVCGLASSTVEALRPSVQTQRRVGRDGRSRPVDRRAVQAEIAERIDAEPGVSVHEIATELGVSPTTIRRVVKDRRAPSAGDDTAPGAATQPMLDPDLFMRWLRTNVVAEREGIQLVGQLPKSQAPAVAKELRRRAEYWSRLADRVDQLAAT